MTTRPDTKHEALARTRDQRTSLTLRAWYPAESPLWKSRLLNVGNSGPTDRDQHCKPRHGFFAPHVDTSSPISRHSADTFSHG
jgi:hypothetical protein